MSVPGDVVPIVGAVYLLAEPEYRYGAGPLLIRVTRVIGATEFGAGGRVEARCRRT